MVASGRLWLWAIPLLGALALASRATGARHDLHGSGAARVLHDRDCVRCHAAIVREWTSSEHARSGDALFRRAAAAEPAAAAFCEGCHFGAPKGEVRRHAAADPPGIGCTSCHGELVRDLISHHAFEGSPSARAKHAGHECAGCHEFAFPGERSAPAMMQTTVSEHAASPHAGTRCVECHLPSVRDGLGSHRSHAFAQARDEAKLRQALSVTAERRGETGLRLTLRSERVGHAFPTGDLFRRLVVEAEALGDDFAVVAAARRDLARHFSDGARDGRRERSVASDDRVPPDGERCVELDLGEAARGKPLTWRVRYERVLHLNPRHEADAVVDSSVLLASGDLPEKP